MTATIITPRRDVTAKQLRRTMYWLTQDWIYLHNNLPTPSGGGQGRTSNVRMYGHPAEWASDQCARIAWMFWTWHDYAATIRRETRPTTRRTAAERDIIVAAWRYLEPRLDDLLEARTQLPIPYALGQTDWAISDDSLQEFFDLHSQIRSRTGQSIRKFTLAMPCPSTDCGMLTLERVRGIGQDYIACGACGYTVKETHYPFLVKLMIDTLIDAAA